jgi:hypothetical protein
LYSTALPSKSGVKPSNRCPKEKLINSTRTRKIRATILNEPFSYPLAPFGVYEITPDGRILRELTRCRTYREALRTIRQFGWIY